MEDENKQPKKICPIMTAMVAPLASPLKPNQLEGVEFTPAPCVRDACMLWDAAAQTCGLKSSGFWKEARLHS